MITKTGKARNTKTIFRDVARDLSKIAPQARIDHRWSGQVIVTPDGLPYIGPNEDDQFIATGYSGNGFTFGAIAAAMARDWITGVKNPWSDLFAPERKKIRGSIWDYLRENKDYPYHMLRDRLRASEGKSVRAVKRNEGKILRIGGKRLAYFATPMAKLKKCQPSALTWVAWFIGIMPNELGIALVTVRVSMPAAKCWLAQPRRHSLRRNIHSYSYS